MIDTPARNTGNAINEPVTVRYALIDDLPTVLGLYMDALEEIKQHILEPDLDKCADEVLFAWSQAPCVLLEKGGEIVGFAGLKTLVATYTNQPQLSEYMIHVKKEHRSVLMLKLLIEKIKSISDEFHIPLVLHFGTFSNGIDKSKRLSEMMGLKPCQLTLIYGGNNG